MAKDSSSSIKSERTYDGSGQPIDDNQHVAQSNDGAEFTEQQDASGTIGGGPEPTNDQSQNQAQTDANLQAQQDRYDKNSDAGVVEPAPGADASADNYNNPANPPVETRPVEQTAPNEETPGYEGQ